MLVIQTLFWTMSNSFLRSTGPQYFFSLLVLTDSFWTLTVSFLWRLCASFDYLATQRFWTIRRSATSRKIEKQIERETHEVYTRQLRSDSAHDVHLERIGSEIKENKTVGVVNWQIGQSLWVLLTWMWLALQIIVSVRDVLVSLDRFQNDWAACCCASSSDFSSLGNVRPR